MARPVKTAVEKRLHVVAFRVTDGERAALSAKAAMAGLELGDFSRAAALGRAVRVAKPGAAAAAPVSFALVDQLRRIGANLNQLTRISYLGHDRSDELGAAAHELRQVLADLRALLDRMHGD